MFENDDALDWMLDLELMGASAVTSAFDTVLAYAESGTIEAADAAVALAAAAVVAASVGAGTMPTLTPDLVADVDTRFEEIAGLPDVRQEALDAVERIIGNPDRSELLQLWSDAAPEDSVAFGDRVDMLVRKLER
ncbi:DUF4259 domain-containing protein [Bauldia sp.]|uniref:DUF4259 domain-containing protein n=1 Tax=Bauldia sp. TaxID=2575872 RepID=UPI003BACCCA2